GNLLREQSEFFEVRRRMKVEHGPDVEQSSGSMAIIRSLEAVARHERLQACDIRGQIARPNGRVFDPGNRLGVALAPGQQGKARFAQGPNQRGLGASLEDGGAQAQMEILQRGQALRYVVKKFNRENRLARRVIQLEQVAG